MLVRKIGRRFFVVLIVMYLLLPLVFSYGGGEGGGEGTGSGTGGEGGEQGDGDGDGDGGYCGDRICDSGETGSSCPTDCCVSNIGQSCNSCGGTIQCDGSCSPSQPPNYGQSCGTCGRGTIQCDGSCSGDYSVCGSAGWYNTGSSCGNCGTQQRYCNGCDWTGSYQCVNQGVCSPGSVQTQDCGGGNCGTQSRTCTSSCGWGGWSSCNLKSGNACFDGQTTSQSCNTDTACGGSQSGTCANCQWSWGSCGGGTNCNSLDGNYCSGNTAESRNYFCSGGGCTYTVTSSTDCNSFDGWYCNGDTREYRDYFCSGGGCTYTVTSSENCATKASTDSDGSCSAYQTGGTVTDYVTCSGSACTSNSYPDSCSGTVLTEYCASGSSFTSSQYECQNFETTFCSNGKLYRNEWSCGSSPGACFDTGTDTPIGTDTDGDGVDHQCQDTTCDNAPGVCDTAVAGKCIAKSGENTVALCTDGLDNDCDGAADANDNGCYGTIQGTVQDKNGNPIQGARISVVDKNNNEIAFAFTNANGDYSITVPFGDYKIIASHSDYVSKVIEGTLAPLGTLTISFTGDDGLVLGSTCEADCTYAGDNTLHAGCDGKNGCSFYDATAAQVCDLAQPGWERPYDDDNVVVCPSGPLKPKAETQAEITCEGENIVKITKIVVYKGQPVNMVITVCG